jgi:hypothetical protein
VKDPVRFARNAALLSGIPAAGVIAAGLLVEDSAILIILGIAALWLALAGVMRVMRWARRERQRAEATHEEEIAVFSAVGFRRRNLKRGGSELIDSLADELGERVGELLELTRRLGDGGR